MLRAYFDESGTHGNDTPGTVIAGFVGAATDWDTVEAQWSARLAEDGLSEFHYVAFENRTGPWASMERWQRDPILADLAAILAASNLFPVSFGYKGPWRPNIAKHPLWKPERYATAYPWCFERAMNLLTECSRDNFGSEPISVVFALHNKYSASAFTEFCLQKGNEFWSELGAIDFDSPSSLPALQTADALAYEMFQLVKLNRDPRFKWPILKALSGKVLGSAASYNRIQDEGGFKEDVERGPFIWLARDPSMWSKLGRETVVYLSAQPLDPDPWTPSPEGLEWWSFS